jgi:hypothetical protein
MGDKPFRLTRKGHSRETGNLAVILIGIGLLIRGCHRRTKAIWYHPIALLGLIVLPVSYLLSHWLTAALFWALLAWQRVWPYSFHQHVSPRITSFFVGIKYRWNLRNKLTANGLLNDKDPTPTISRTQIQGCTTTIIIKMSYGDDSEYWRQRSSRIAQTFNAKRAVINPLYREVLNPFKHDLTEKYRWLRIDFLTRDPFAKTVGIEYIHQYRIQIITTTNPQGELTDTYQPAIGDPVGPTADGTPYLLAVRTHLLNISMTGGGKSNAERTMIFTGYREVLNLTKENWGCDLARGVELNPIRHCFARIEDGKPKNGMTGPEAVLRFWEDVRDIMHQRLDDMNENGIVLHQPTPNSPALDVYFDEIAVLESVPYAQVRKAIYAAISEVLLVGRKTKISIRGFTQKSKLENLPIRDEFPETQLGRVKTRSQVNTAMDYEAHDRGAKANEIRADQPGIYYAETETAMAPIAFRFCETTLHDMKQLPQHPASVLWTQPPSIEQIFTSLPVDAHPQPEPIPAQPQARRLHLSAARRPKQKQFPQPEPTNAELEHQEVRQ